MARVTITGGSDDLIEIGGDISEEFNSYDNEDGKLLAFSDGTVLRIVYDKDGIWRVTRLTAGSAKFEKVDGDVAADTFDVATLSGDVRWCVIGESWAQAKGAPDAASAR